MNDLLREAIADAKAVREVALANAKLALEEAFTPKLQSMLSKKLSEEAEYEEKEYEETDESVFEADDDMENDSSEEDMPVKEEEGDVSALDKIGKSDDEDEMDIDEFFSEADGDEEMGSPVDDEESVKEGEDEDEIDEDLMEIIRQLEEDIDSSGIGTGDNKKPSPVASGDSTEDKKEKLVQLVNEEDEENSDDIEEMMRSIREEDEEDGKKEKVEEAEEDDETIDIKEILRALREEEDETKEKMDENEDEDEDASKKVAESKLREAYAVITFLRSKINEVNLLNSKLLFSSKIFKKYSLSENQKYTVIENFDRASSLREVKLVYATLCEAIKSSKTNVKPIKESFASKPIGSTRPKNIINENDNMTERLKYLAGLK